MADRFWRGGTAAWDGTAGAKWAATAGGATGAAVPTSADDVFFDATSSGTCTISAGNIGAKSINCTGFTGTLAGSAILFVSGSITLSAGMTMTYTGTFFINATGTLTTAGKTLGSITVSGASTTVTLGDALNLGSNTLQADTGSFNTGNYNVTAGAITSGGASARTLTFGSSTITLSLATAINFGTNINLTVNAGTSSIVLSNASVILFSGPTDGGTGVTFYNVSFTSTAAGTHQIRAVNTFNNLSITAPASAGVRQITFDSRQTINGTLSTTGTAGNRRVWFRGVTYGLAQTLTVNSAPSLTDADFRDIYVIGTAAPISGTRVGDLRGCRGITFDTPKAVYWVTAAGGNWSGNNWAASSGAGASTDNFPLAQDTAVIENTGLNTSATVTLDSAVPYTGTVTMSTRTNAMTFAIATSPAIYGNWTNGSGTAMSGSGTLSFSGRNTQIITSAGKSFGTPINITVDSYGGSVELADALNIGGNNLTVTNGTFDTKNYNVTGGQLSSNNSNVRAITLGSSTLTLNATSPLTLTIVDALNLTFNAGTSQINFTTTSGSSITTGGVTYYNVSYTGTSAVQHSNNSTVPSVFNNFTITAPAATGIVQYTFAANHTITGTLTVAGASPVRRIFVRSGSLGTTRTLTVGTLSATDCDFRDITIAGTAAGSSPTRAGDCGGNSGITFPAPKTVYWNLAGAQNWSATAWAPGSGGSPDINNFPLAQDTAVFDEAGSVTGTITINLAWNIGTFDASARTSAMTLTTSTNSPFIYGDWKFGTGVTSSSTTGTITFAKRGTQTITSNGVTFGCNISIQPFSTTQLGDALIIGSTRTLSLFQGVFDAVTYNVTIGLFSNTSVLSTLKMGSGTWTLSGVGNVWQISATPVFYKGTANIVLSDTSTTARTFSGGALSYNKLTIGGATGTSTTTINDSNQFTELASTKTVAHTIALGLTTQTFGKWTVTGTSGNVVTLTGTGTSHILAGACTDSIDYLAMGSIGFAATSPGEFYAGANSTGTAGAPVYRTAKPADSTRYWVGGTGNWSDTARWSTGSGGGSGASVPRSHDDVVFDSASNATAYTATVNAVTGGIRMKALTIAGPASGNVTLAGSTAIVGIHGNVTLPATGLTRTYTGNITLTGSTSGKTLTTNGVTLAATITINGVGCEWALGSALNNGPSNLSITNGSFDLASYNLTIGNISCTSQNSVTLSLSTSSITTSGTLNFGTTETNRANLTVIAGTSQITCSQTSSTFSGNNQTFYNVAFTSTSAGTVTINGANTFNDLSVTGITSAGLKIISVTADQTINGTLTLSAGTNATMRHFVRSDTIGTTRTLTCAAVSLTDVDFRDITIAGVAAPATGTRIGDCKGNSGITFTAAANKYWNLAGNNNWSATGWALSSGASPAVNNFPLAQDTCIFESTSPGTGATTTINAAYNIGTIDMSARTTNTMTLSASQIFAIYGNWINGTGTTLTGSSTVSFAGRGSQTITSAGKTFPHQIVIETPGGSVTLQDSFTTSVAASFQIRFGTFDANNYSFTLSSTSSSAGVLISPNTTVTIGSGTWTIAGSSLPWNWTGSPNFTVTGTGTLSFTSASAKTFVGGDRSYTNITLDQGGAGTLTIIGNNTFKDITNTYKATGATAISLGTTTQRVSQWTAAGEAGRVLTVQGTSASSPATLILTGATPPNVDYLTITGVRAYSLIDTWYAGANSTNNGSLGWYFQAASGTIITASFQDTATGSDQFSAVATFLVSFQDTATGSDQVSSSAVFGSVFQDTATGTDQFASGLLVTVDIAESGTGSDSIAAVLIVNQAVSESSTATDSISAIATFTSAISELSTGTDTVSALGVLVCSVVELVEFTDAVSATGVLNSATSEVATGVDTLSASTVFLALVADTAASQDQFSATATFFGNVNETTSSTDQFVVSATFTSAISELSTSLDAFSTTASFIRSVSDSATGTDETNRGFLVVGVIDETATGADQIAATATYSQFISEFTTASDVISTTGVFGATVNETVTTIDLASASVLFVSVITESSTITDSIASLVTFASSFTDTASGTDSTLVAASTFNAPFSDSATITDANVGFITFPTVIDESATGTDSDVSFLILPTSISESATGTDTTASAQTFAVTIQEQSAALDSVLVAPSVFNAPFQDTVQAIDVFRSNTIFPASVAEQIAMTDTVIGGYLWNPVDDSQGAVWQDANTTQTPGWTDVNTTQTATWTDVNTTQSPGWTDVNDSQTPGWTPVLP